MTRILFLDWLHWCFIPEVRKNSVNKGLPFKILILDNVSGHPDPHEFNNEGVKVVYLPSKQHL